MKLLAMPSAFFSRPAAPGQFAKCRLVQRGGLREQGLGPGGAPTAWRIQAWG